LSEYLNKLIELAYVSKDLEIQDPSKFLLKNPLKLDAEKLRLITNQVLFNQKFSLKIPEWASKKGELVAPPKVSLEQASSSFTAQFKANLMKGKKGADLSGGLGVDTFFISKNFSDFIYLESSPELFEIVNYNLALLGIENTKFINSTAEVFLEELAEKDFDWIYLDPDRRNIQNKKLFKIEDCSPNLHQIESKLLSISKNIMVKYSPMLDIKLSTKLFPNIHKIIVLAEKNEVKELLLVLNQEETNSPEIVSINKTTQNTIQEFSFNYREENSINLNFAFPEKYLYEPNAAIMKSGGFKSIAQKYKVNKIAPNSHLYSSIHFVEDFPGRTFAIQNVVNYDKKEILSNLPSKKANLACRNFPYKVEHIKKEIGLMDGGDDYLFFSETEKGKKIVIISQKIL